MIQYLITAIIDMAVGILAFSNKANPAAKALSLTAFSLGLWSLELYLLTVIKNINILEVVFHITRWGMFFIPATFSLLTWMLVGGRSEKFKIIVVIPSFILSGILCLTNAFIFPSPLKEVEGGYLPEIDAIYYLFLFGFLWGFIGSISLVLTSYKSSSTREQQRLKWLMITLCVSFIGGALGLYSISSEFYLSRFIGSITNIVFIALLFYSTIQHNLMDYRFALSVGLSKAILLGVFIWLYFFVTSVIGDQTKSTGGILVLFLFVTLLLEAYPRLLRWLLPNAKKIFAKNSYEFHQIKEDTKKALNGSISYSSTFDVLNHLFLKILKLRNYRVLLIESDTDSTVAEKQHPYHNTPFEFIHENQPLSTYCQKQAHLILADEMPIDLRDEMTKYEATLCIPIFSDQRFLAVILLGEAINLSYYRYDDVKIFEWLKGELGQVFDRLIRLDSMQNQLGEAKKTLSMLNLMNHYHHDIKAPFAIIDGVLSNDIYDRDKQREIVLAQVERGSRLIATMASILGGHHQRRVKSCDLGALVEDCLYLFETSFDHINRQLNPLPKIHGDAEDLKILFINLFKNAAEARRPNAELAIGVNTWMENGNLYVAIQDNGVGMTEEQLATLWEPNFSTKERGNGIGMQAIKRIADEHNAHIAVKSEQITGTNFTLCFFAGQIVAAKDNEDKIADELALKRSTLTTEKRELK